MKVLIGGGSGFVGRALQQALRKNGHAVTIVSRKAGESRITWDSVSARGKRQGRQGVLCVCMCVCVCVCVCVCLYECVSVCARACLSVPCESQEREEDLRQRHEAVTGSLVPLSASLFFAPTVCAKVSLYAPDVSSILEQVVLLVE